MKPTFRSLLPILVLLVVFSSCSNKMPKEARLIPKDASAVIILDPGAMQDKLNNGGISVDTLLSRIFKHDSTDGKDKARIEEFRTNAGLDWTSKIYYFVQQEGNLNENATTSMTVMASLSDATKFEAWLKQEQETKEHPIEQGKDYSYMLLDDNVVISWNKEVAMTTIQHSIQKPTYDTVAMEFKIPEKKDLSAQVIKSVESYHTQGKDASLASVDAFKNMFKEKADGYFFTSSNSALSMMNGLLPLSLPKVEELLKDNYSTATLSFENGKIVAKSSSYTNPVLSNILKKYAGPTVNLNSLERYPSNNINGMMLLAVNPEILGGILKELEIEGLANGSLEKIGLQASDLYKCLNGEAALIVSDLGKGSLPDPQERKDEKGLTQKQENAKMIFHAAIGDKASFAKLMDKAVEAGYLKKEGSLYKGGELMSLLGIYMQADDKDLIVASDSLTYQQYAANTSRTSIDPNVLNQFKGKNGVLYFDIANTIAGFNKNNTTGDYNQSMRTAQETFKDVIGTSENFDGKSLKAVMEIRMQNEKQNSLVTLTSLLTDIAVDMRVASRRKQSDEHLFPAGVPALIRTN